MLQMERLLPGAALGQRFDRRRAVVPAGRSARGGPDATIARFLMVGGCFKIVAAVSYQFAAWGWSLVGGIIDVILGVRIWQERPASALAVIGLFVGINLLFRGLNWIALGLAWLATPPADGLSPSHEKHSDAELGHSDAGIIVHVDGCSWWDRPGWSIDLPRTPSTASPKPVRCMEALPGT